VTIRRVTPWWIEAFNRVGATGTFRRLLMQIIGIFILFTALLDAAGAGVCTIVERYSANASLFVFLGLFVVNFMFAWKLAVYVTEKYLVTKSQREKNEDHIRWVDSLFVTARR
jgi:hypothetical protein